MPVAGAIREGQVLSGPLFNEPMRVETVRPQGPDAWVADTAGGLATELRQVLQELGLAEAVRIE